MSPPTRSESPAQAPWWLDLALIVATGSAFAWLGRRGPVSAWAETLLGGMLLVSGAHLAYGWWRAARSRLKSGTPEA